MADRPTFTGRARDRRTRWSVRFFDRVATWLITVGGIGTIVAVSGVCLYLLWTVAPLFLPVSTSNPVALRQQSFDAPVDVLRVADSNAIGWALDRSGRLTVFRPDQGETLSRESLAVDGRAPTAISAGLSSDAVALGFDDGTVKLGSIRFETVFLDATGDGAKKFDSLKPGDRATDETGVVQRTEQGLLRRESIVAEFEGEPVEISPGDAVVRLDTMPTDAGPVLLAWSKGGTARIATIGSTEDLFTGEVRLEAGTVASLPLPEVPDGPPLFAGLAARAAGATLVWPDGTILRFDVRNAAQPRLIEQARLGDGTRSLTCIASMVGRLTLLVGDESGNVAAWFPVREAAETGGDAEAAAAGGSRIVRGHDLGTGPAAVAAIAPSSRSREATIGYADGAVRIFQVTNEVELASVRLPQDAAGKAMTLYLPPGEGETNLFAAAGGSIFSAPLDLRHPESSFATYFRPIWYESYAESRHVWQTSSGTNAAEPKLGLMPLIFGTLKATFYSMLFGVPLALLAALYTSEFLSKPARARIKPLIEVMASLPSVVLGFLAAIVFAPLVEDWLPAVIAAGLTIPFALLAAAHLWQIGSWSARARWSRWRLPLAGLALVVGTGAAIVIGPLLERVLFAGNIKLWLDGQIGTGAGAWMLMLVPVCAIGVTAAMIRWLNPIVTEASRRWGAQRFAVVDLSRFLGAVAVTLIAAALLSWLLAGLDAVVPFDLDPRGSFVDTFTQRNALVVGFVMGFAIIPLIYTLADDALSAVPESLRSASLGAGATQWQTALRVVIPTAMSGLFSAIMVGLGRAVGETMIVLMAAGNTPVMDLNIFNGFQTLSAAIATEMPEAVHGSTHFRTLFLAALVLFGLTFLVNTVAELVRIRFRRRVVQL